MGGFKRSAGAIHFSKCGKAPLTDGMKPASSSICLRTAFDCYAEAFVLENQKDPSQGRRAQGARPTLFSQLTKWCGGEGSVTRHVAENSTRGGGGSRDVPSLILTVQPHTYFPRDCCGVYVGTPLR